MYQKEKVEFKINFDINNKIFLKDPENSPLGREIVKKSIDLIYQLGFEHFTFKKLAIEINSTEATIYRYFENKHRLLLYILNWYWCYMDFLIGYKLENIKDKKERLKIVISLFTKELSEGTSQLDYNKKYLNHIVIAESSKVYLVKEVTEINKNAVFKPYKDLCSTVAGIITEYNPKYKFPRSLATTLIETSHDQQFFSINLPKLTDVNPKSKTDFTTTFIEDLFMKVLTDH